MVYFLKLHMCLRGVFAGGRWRGWRTGGVGGGWCIGDGGRVHRGLGGARRGEEG